MPCVITRVARPRCLPARWPLELGKGQMLQALARNSVISSGHLERSVNNIQSISLVHTKDWGNDSREFAYT